MSVIQNIHDEHGGSAWRDYDEQFRHRWQGDTRLSLGKMDMELWMKLVGNTKQGGNAPFRKGPGGRPGSHSASRGSKGACWAFNDLYCKRGESCKYKHVCSQCGGSHPIKKCFKARGNRSQGRGREAPNTGPNTGQP
ncbi:hypothetical protein FKM82_022057 [Ascaphus truei]